MLRLGQTITVLSIAFGSSLTGACRDVPDTFTCTSASQCSSNGEAGRCEPNQRCSQPEASCPSGWKYRAAGELDGQCVGGGGRLDAGGTTCPAFALLCDDFESGDLSKWTTLIVPTGASSVVDGMQPHGGSRALHLSVPTNTDMPSCEVVQAFAKPASGVIAVRAYLSDVTPSNNFYNGTLSIYNDADQSRYVSAVVNGAGQWNVTEPGQDHMGSAANVPADTWYCQEMVYTFPGAGPGRIQLFVDGVSVLDTASVDPTPGYDHVGLGVLRARKTGDQRFIDDVVIADRRIGCE